MALIPRFLLPEGRGLAHIAYYCATLRGLICCCAVVVVLTCPNPDRVMGTRGQRKREHAARCILKLLWERDWRWCKMARSQVPPGYIAFVAVYTPITSRAGLFSEAGRGQAGFGRLQMKQEALHAH